MHCQPSSWVFETSQDDATHLVLCVSLLQSTYMAPEPLGWDHWHLTFMAVMVHTVMGMDQLSVMGMDHRVRLWMSHPVAARLRQVSFLQALFDLLKMLPERQTLAARVVLTR